MFAEGGLRDPRQVFMAFCFAVSYATWEVSVTGFNIFIRRWWGYTQ